MAIWSRERVLCVIWRQGGWRESERQRQSIVCDMETRRVERERETETETEYCV